MEIPGYRIKGEVGRGGMATVYLAVQESLDREVALKLMSPALSADEGFSRRFLNEAKTVAKLTHPNILAVYDVGCVDHHHYIAMEYVGGGDLRQKIRKGLSREQTIQIVRQIGSALAHAHREGCVHRDIKPENILFRKDGTAVLSDFGIARTAGAGTKMTVTGVSLGTPYYMSPEQARGKDVDGRADLYSLGVVLYEMLTGSVPYDAEDPFAIVYSHVHDPLPRLPGTLSLYQPIVDRLLAKEAEDRFSTAEELAAALDRLTLSTKTVSISKENATTVAAGRTIALRPAAKKLPGKGFVGGLAVAAVIAVMVVSYFYKASAPSPPNAPLPTGQSELAEEPAYPHEAAETPSQASVRDKKPRPTAVPSRSEKKAAKEPPTKKRPDSSRRKAAVASPEASRRIISNRLGMQFVYIRPGSYFMGSPSTENGREEDESRHRVAITKGFFIQTTEVTQGQWQAIMGNNPSHFKNCGQDCPVEEVSWEDAQMFIRKLNQQSDGPYRLPTEAEWEYACRAGSETPFAAGDCLKNSANYNGNFPLVDCAKSAYPEKTLPVGSFAPNGWGLYDMHGNVWEWCRDWYGDYPAKSVTDPKGPSSGLFRIYRGGAWSYGSRYCRSANRHGSSPGIRMNYLGFRLVREEKR